MPYKDPESQKEYYRQRYMANRERLLARMKEWYENNRQDVLDYQRSYYSMNKERIAEAGKAYRDRLKREGKLPARDEYFSEYRKRNAARISHKAKEFRKSNPEVVAGWQRTYENGNIAHRLRTNLRRRIGHAIRGRYKPDSAVRGLGCSVESLIAHIESKFREGMSWSNYGKWHIDHIMPLAAFDLTDEEQFMAACHYTNLQPLWACDNLSKGSRIISKHLASSTSADSAATVADVGDHESPRPALTR